MDRIASAPVQRHKETQLILFPLLAKRGIAKTWADTLDPRSEVLAECQKIAGDPAFMASLNTYLGSNPIIRASCESMLAQLALAAGVKWQETDAAVQPLSRRGWHLGRWLPTFLLINGPLGRLLKDKESPLSQRLRVKYSGFPLLSGAKDAFNSETFRLIRNGFGHWSFEWIDLAGHSEVKIVDHETGKETARVSVLECEALHLLTCTVVEAIATEIFAKSS